MYGKMIGVMKMEMLQIQYFIAVAKQESISRAAQAFMVPASSVSVAIKKLEQSLGFALFDRTANRLRLNAYGKIFLRAVEEASETLAQAKVEMQNLSNTVAGEIRLLILSNRSHVTACISAFNEQYPDVSFHIRHEGLEQYREYDLVITDRFAEDAQYESKLFCREEVRLAVPKTHRLSKAETVSLSDLRGEKFICMPKGSSLGDYTHSVLESVGIQPKVSIECDDPQYIRRYVKMGLGISFFPMYSWQIQADDSICLLHMAENLHRESYVHVKKDALKAAKLFGDALLKIMKK